MMFSKKFFVSFRIYLLSFSIFISVFAILGCGGTGGSMTSSVAHTPNPAASSAPSTPPGPPAPPPPAPTPTPPPVPASAGTVIDHLEDNPWLTCGNCGNTGASGATAAYFDTRGISSPSVDGSSTKFSLAASVPFSNGYFYQQQTPITSQINALTYEFDFYVPVGSENLPEAFEFECQQILNGWVYNFAWQALYSGNRWRIFDYGLKRWDDAGLPFTRFTPGTWHHIVAEYHNDTATHTVIHDALTIDGTRYPINITHKAFFSGYGSPQFTDAVQLDSNSAAAAYSIYVDGMKITYR